MQSTEQTSTEQTREALLAAIDSQVTAERWLQQARIRHRANLVADEERRADYAGGKVIVDGKRAWVQRWSITTGTHEPKIRLFAHVHLAKVDGSPSRVEYGNGWSVWSHGWEG